MLQNLDSTVHSCIAIIYGDTARLMIKLQMFPLGDLDVNNPFFKLKR